MDELLVAHDLRVFANHASIRGVHPFGEFLRLLLDFLKTQILDLSVAIFKVCIEVFFEWRRGWLVLDYVVLIILRLGPVQPAELPSPRVLCMHALITAETPRAIRALRVYRMLKSPFMPSP